MPANPTRKVKQVAILGGGDWADASVVHLQVSANLVIANAHKEYEQWRKDQNKWMPFEEWLRKFKSAEDSTVEEFYEE